MKQTHLAAASRTLLVACLAAVLVACGGDDKSADQLDITPTRKNSGDQTAAATATPQEDRMATAVATGKTSAPVDLQYDLLSKPDVGQPFEIELVFLPRLAADTLEAEISAIPGLTLVSGGGAKFEPVVAGERYTAKVLVNADAAGIYYVNVVARMITKVQTDARAFSIPVVVGTAPAAEKAAPAQDATGQAIQSMPAAETATSEPAKP
jgi:hypothetical protein